MQISDSIVEFTSDNGRLYHCRIELTSAPKAKIFWNFKLQNDIFLSKTLTALSKCSRNVENRLKSTGKIPKFSPAYRPEIVINKGGIVIKGGIVKRNTPDPYLISQKKSPKTQRVRLRKAGNTNTSIRCP